MAKIVIAGVCNCPHYARAEILADALSFNLPDFKCHKITKLPNEWEEWLASTCQSKGWSHKKSPIVWRELVDRGGKGILIGGANEFQEYVNGYYNICSDMDSELMLKIAEENLQTEKELRAEEEERLSRVKPIRFCITNASSVAAYSVVNAIASGAALGSETDVAICLYDKEENLSVVQGVEMEARDLASAVLRDTSVTSDLGSALANCHILILLDEVSRETNETKEDWLKRNYEHYMVYAQSIESHSQMPSELKVVVGGPGPVNFITNMLIRHTKNLAENSVIGVSWLVENNAKAVLAEKLKISNSAFIRDVVVWGSVNGKHVVDPSRGKVYNHDGAIWGPDPFHVPLIETVHDNEWLLRKFQKTVDTRCKSVEASLGHSAAMMKGDAISSLVRHLWNGCQRGDVHSLAIPSKGWYGVPDGLVFSFPVKFTSPKEFVVQDKLSLPAQVAAKMDDIIEELELEVEAIFPNPDRKPRPKKEKVAKNTPEPEKNEMDATESSTEEGGNMEETGDAEDNAASLEKISEDVKGEEVAEHEQRGTAEEEEAEEEEEDEITE